jgi:hydroxymethylpyrimidine kinase/phosphomethylpyrimidine kinase
MSQHEYRPAVLTIAGLDPSGGAGVIADVRTLSALGCRATAAITSLTFQNDREVLGAEHLSPESVRAQVLSVICSSNLAASKTGMLPTSEIVSEVARLFRETALPAPVVDPVMRSTSGYQLIEPEALATLLAELLPLARVITPNIPEAERITGLLITDESQMRRAAAAMRKLGARAVLLKGGHLGGHLDRREAVGGRKETGGAANIREAIDVLDDEGKVTVFRGAWIDAGNVRGSGCMLSAAIAAGLAKGMSLTAAVATAKDFVREAILHSVR